mgnify:FL=1
MAPVSQLDLSTHSEIGEPQEDAGRPIALPPTDGERARITDALGPTPVEIDEIIRHTGSSAQTVYLVLLELDLAGRLHRHAGGLVSIDMG